MKFPEISGYVIREQLGDVELGTSYHAFSDKLKKDVVVEVFNSKAAGKGTQVSILAPMLELVGQMPNSLINHPNVATIYDVGRSGDDPYFIREFSTGKTLCELNAKKFRNSEQIGALGTAILGGLEAIYRVGYVPPVVEPASVVITKQGQPLMYSIPWTTKTPTNFEKLGDWLGMLAGSKSLGNVVAGGTDLAFQAPEILKGNTKVGYSDLFSLGTLLYAIGAGRLPFQADTIDALREAILEKNPQSVSEFNEYLSGPVARAIDGLLSKDPVARLEPAEHLLSLTGSSFSGLRDVWQQPFGRITGEIESDNKSLVYTLNTKSSDKLEIDELSEEREYERYVNTWFERDDEGPVVCEGEWSTFRMKIDETELEQSGSKRFKEPDFGDRNEIELLVSLFSGDLEFRERVHLMVVPKKGPSDTIATEVKPLHGGRCRLDIVISLNPDLELLQALHVDVEAHPVATVSTES